MNQNNIAKTKFSTRVLYGWAISLMSLGFGLLYLILFTAQRTSCANGCQTFYTIGNIVRPIGVAFFLIGLGLLAGNTVRLIIRALKRS